MAVLTGDHLAQGSKRVVLCCHPREGGVSAVYICIYTYLFIYLFIYSFIVVFSRDTSFTNKLPLTSEGVKQNS